MFEVYHFCLAWTEFSKRLCDHSFCTYGVYVACSMSVVICKIDHCIHIHWCIVMGLGHNDPWVESHMWPQQTWGQRSSRGQWPLVQVFGKKGHQCIHILWCIFKSIKYYNDCKSMWWRKQARHMVREPPCCNALLFFQFIYFCLVLFCCFVVVVVVISTPEDMNALTCLSLLHLWFACSYFAIALSICFLIL